MSGAAARAQRAAAGAVTRVPTALSPVPTWGDPFEALGDPHRRAIVELLGAGGAGGVEGSTGGRTVQELADALPISRPAVSRHLRLLKSAGLVVDQPLGTRRLYRLHNQGVQAVQAYLAQVWGEAAARFRLMAENTAPEQAPVQTQVPEQAPSDGREP